MHLTIAFALVHVYVHTDQDITKWNNYSQYKEYKRLLYVYIVEKNISLFLV